MDKDQEYQKHEFCKAMECGYLRNGGCALDPYCCHSARALHGWLEAEGFRLVRTGEEQQ